MPHHEQLFLERGHQLDARFQDPGELQCFLRVTALQDLQMEGIEDGTEPWTVLIQGHPGEDITPVGADLFQ